MDFSWIADSMTSRNLIATAIFALIILIGRSFISRYIRRADKNWTSQQRLRWIGLARTTAFGILLLGLIWIWGEQIQGFAVSVFAIAFAMVFSVKELFMCFNGSLIRMRGHLFEIGDRIWVKDVRGDVIDTTFLSTTVLEVGSGAANHQYTGRRITFPNSLLLTERVVNESFLENYYMNNITIPLPRITDWKSAKQILLQIAQEECAPYIEQARRRMQQIERNRSLELPSVEPRVTLQLQDIDTIHLHLRIPSPAHLKGRLEQVVLTRFLEQFGGNND